VNADSKDEYGRTPLSQAAENGHDATIKLLLHNSRVDVNSRDNNGQTPLSWAAARGEAAVVELLLATGKVNADSKDEYGRTPLSRATGNGHDAIAKLLTRSVDHDHDDDDGSLVKLPKNRIIEAISRQSLRLEFWRIQNIKSSEKDAAVMWLRKQMEELEISEGQGFSVAADGERTFCATLTSRDCPRPSNRSWRVDKDFIGVTPLNDPEDANVDIVAVTGPGGHALGSFRSTDGKSVWLRDFAPGDIPRARFITYGYDTAVFKSDDGQGVQQLAHTLLDSLAIFRQRTQTQQRPLVFVCYSLGGVILKEALVMSSKAADAKHRKVLEIVTMTYGLVFMGVPNLGLKHKQLETIVSGRPNEGLVRDLLVRSDGEASQFLSHLTHEFSDLDERRSLPFEIVSYYETVRSPMMVVSISRHAIW
jgi:hypothetical protein